MGVNPTGTEFIPLQHIKWKGRVYVDRDHLVAMLYRFQLNDMTCEDLAAYLEQSWRPQEVRGEA